MTFLPRRKAMTGHRIFGVSVASVYPAYIAKASARAAPSKTSTKSSAG